MKRAPLNVRRRIEREQRDELVRLFTAFGSWDELAAAIAGGYSPTLRPRVGLRAGRSALMRALRVEVAVQHGPDRVFPELTPEERVRVLRRRQVAA